MKKHAKPEFRIEPSNARVVQKLYNDRAYDGSASYILVK